MQIDLRLRSDFSVWLFFQHSICICNKQTNKRQGLSYTQQITPSENACTSRCVAFYPCTFPADS
jgi:hypothetical protein